MGSPQDFVSMVALPQVSFSHRNKWASSQLSSETLRLHGESDVTKALQSRKKITSMQQSYRML